MGKKLLILIVLVGGFTAILIANAVVSTPAKIPDVAPGENVSLKVDPESLANALSYRTVSFENQNIESQHFKSFITYLKKQFPRVHQTLKLEIVNELSLLYIWPGVDARLAPVLLTGHYDVVPAHGNHEENTWEHPPFENTIADGYIWGRGAMDDKAAVISILTATESLLADNFQPARTLVYAFGHDEETGGKNGAQHLAKKLQEKNLNPEWMLDEGMPITDGVLSAVKTPLAMVGIAEKGYATLTLQVKSDGGHSSTPPSNTAAGILSAAIVKLEANPMPARIDGATEAMFNRIMPQMGLLPRVLFSNRWLFEPILKRQLSGSPTSNALVRTTAAVTMLNASNKSNVLPLTASATVNYRLLPGDTVDDIIAHVQNVIDDPRVSVSAEGSESAASPISDYDNIAFQTIETSIKQVFPDVTVTPALLVATTDTRHYVKLTRNIYRFRPLWVKPEDVSRFHGKNERISIENYGKMVEFFKRLMINLDTPKTVAKLN